MTNPHDRVMQRIRAAVTHIAAQEGMTVRFTGGRYTNNWCTYKFTASKVSQQDGETVIQDPERSRWPSKCLSYGMKRRWLDKEMTMNEVRYRITGINTRAKKYPIRLAVLTGPNAGRTVRAGSECVEHAMRTAEAKALERNETAQRQERPRPGRQINV